MQISNIQILNAAHSKRNNTLNFQAKLDSSLLRKSLKASRNDEFKSNYIQEQLKKDKKGNIPMHYADAEEAHKIHEALKKYPEIIKQIHTTKNNKGETPMHYVCNDLECMQVIHNNISEELAAKIHTIKDNDGNIPMRYCNLEGMEEIHKKLINKPEILAQIHTTKNCDGKLILHDISSLGNIDSLDKTREIFKVLKNQSDVINKIITTRDGTGKFPTDYMDKNCIGYIHGRLNENSSNFDTLYTIYTNNINPKKTYYAGDLASSYENLSHYCRPDQKNQILKKATKLVQLYEKYDPSLFKSIKEYLRH